jgi:tRNA(Ile)-lysidine synthetase-like protein
VPVTAAVFEVRRAVRDALAALPDAARRAPLVVGCSGGADSLALTLAAAAVRGPDDVRAVVVDHRLQEGSAERAAATVALLAERGIAARVHAVDVTGPGGIEAAARRARQAALCAARPHPDSPILLGHTLDDQAETVLLGLGRGSGARSLAGMRRWDPPCLRPLLTVRRATTRAACAGLAVWDDPHNADPRFTRVRLRHEVLPLLEDVLSAAWPRRSPARPTSSGGRRRPRRPRRPAPRRRLRPPPAQAHPAQPPPPAPPDRPPRPKPPRAHAPRHPPRACPGRARARPRRARRRPARPPPPRAARLVGRRGCDRSSPPPTSTPPTPSPLTGPTARASPCRAGWSCSAPWQARHPSGPVAIGPVSQAFGGSTAAVYDGDIAATLVTAERSAPRPPSSP